MTKVKNGIKIIVFILMFALIFNTIQGLTMPTFSMEQGTNSGFLYEEEDTVDVLFLGSSNMFHTINPLILYEETGIRGFDFGSSAQSLNMSYMYLTEALKTQSPKVVCLEVYMASGDYNVSGLGEAELRWGFTFFPTNYNSITRLYDQVGEKVDAEFLSYVFPLLRYKSLWWAMGKEDFIKSNKPDYKKGCSMETKIEQVSYEAPYWEAVEWEISESNLNSMNQIKALCDENGIELVLFKSPNTNRWKNAYSEKISEYAEQNGLPFIDYNTMIDELNIDLNTCFMGGGHLNYDGSVLTTKHMAEFLASNYNLQDYRIGEENSWDRACTEWHRREQNMDLAYTTDLGEYLDIVSSGGYTVVFSINGEIDEAHQQVLVKGLGIEAYPGVESGIIKNGTVIALNGRGISYLWRDELDSQDYAIAGNCRDNGSGNMSYDATLYVNGVNCSVVPQGVNIVVYDNVIQEFASVVGFDAKDEYARHFGGVSEVQR